MSAHFDTKAISAAAARWVVRHNAGLSESESGELAQWLAADARHKAAFDHYARTWSAFDGPEAADEQDAMIQRIGERVKRRRLRRVHGAITAVAACAFVALAFTTLRHRHDADKATPTVPPPASVVAVAQPERLVLEDGSTVELRPGAVVDVRYDDAMRRVILAGGGARFHVAKSHERPFVVVAGGVEARAVGTAFTVQLGAEQVEVLVTEGRVAVEKTAPEKTEAEDTAPLTIAADPPGMIAPALAMLAARECIVVKTAPAASADEPAHAVVTLTPAEINARLEWLVPRIEFSATPLAEAVAMINRFPQLPDGSANARLVLAPELSHLASEPVSGIFRADNIETFVHLLGLNMDIEGERHGDEIILRKAKK